LERNSRRPERAQKRRREIVESAARLFDERGYFGTSLDDVAQAVGLRKATLYHYFRGKDEILSSIHDEFLTWTMEREEARAGYGLSPEQHVLESIADILEIIRARPGHIRVFVEHFRELEPAARAEVERKRARYTQMIEQLIRNGMDQGVFRRMDSRLAVLALFGACNWAYHWLPRDPAVDTRQTAYAIWDLLMRGVEAPAVAAPDQNAS
jgi:AcrR family transcriptional regulator